MLRLTCIAFTATLLLSPDVTQVSHLQQQTQQQIPSDQSVPVLPTFDSPAGQDSDTVPALPPAPPPKNAPPLKESSRLEIIRYVSGEFARAAAPLPGGKKGFHMKAGEPLDLAGLKRQVVIYGAALNTGDNAQITRIEFRGSEIVLDINGGGSGAHTPWRNRVQIGVSGVPISGGQVNSGNNGPVIQQKAGVTLFLDFGRPLPDVSSDDVKKYLSVVLDFSKQRSAAVQWTETLPPKVQEAISEKRAEVGMDHDEVLAALGRPDRKVREQDTDGNDTEDWIYGKPPATTVFVRFMGDKVVKVDQYP